MHIGIVPVLRELAGGVYQYSQTILSTLYHLHTDHEFLIFAEDARPLGYLGDSRERWRVFPLQPFTFKRVVKKYVQRILGLERYSEILENARHTDTDEPFDPDVVNYKPDQGRWFAQKGAEVMFYPTTTAMSFESGVPYVIAVHDLQHKLQPEFPEVSANGEAEGREYLFRNAIRYATLVLADSETGKEDILNCYGEFGITEDRIKVLPFLPASYLDQEVTPEEISRVREKYDLPERYLFYPAQFWPHKNHARVVEALQVLKEEYRINAHIVFCGSSSGNIRSQRKEEVLALASQFGLEQQLRVPGYIPNDEMAALYAGAVALVFPTFFGPTNIPVLEAWSLNCPVITSDLRGIREQVGDAAVLVNPKSVEDIAEGIRKVWVSQELRNQLSELGRKKLSAYTPADFALRLNGILHEAGSRIDSMEAS